VNDGTGAGSISGTIQLNDLMRDDTEDFSISYQKTEISCKDMVFLPYSLVVSYSVVQLEHTTMPKGIETTHKCVNCMIVY